MMDVPQGDDAVWTLLLCGRPRGVVSGPGRRFRRRSAGPPKTINKYRETRASRWAPKAIMVFEAFRLPVGTSGFPGGTKCHNGF